MRTMRSCSSPSLTRDAEAVGFREDRLLVDELLDDPLRDAELSQHALVELVAVRGSQRTGPADW